MHSEQDAYDYPKYELSEVSNPSRVALHELKTGTIDSGTFIQIVKLLTKSTGGHFSEGRDITIDGITSLGQAEPPI